MSTFIPTKLAKYVFALIMAIFGVLHFVYGTNMQAMVPSWIPFSPIFWVYFTGLALIAYSISIFINHKYQKIAGYLLAVMLFLFIMLVHMPSMNTNPMALPLMLKDIALAFAAVIIANAVDEE